MLSERLAAIYEASGLKLADEARATACSARSWTTSWAMALSSPCWPIPDVSEVMVNGPHLVYVEHKGRLTQDRGPVRRRRPRACASSTASSAPWAGAWTARSPMVDARLPDGSRVNAIIPPCAIDGPSITIRKFSKDKLTIRRPDQLWLHHPRHGRVPGGVRPRAPQHHRVGRHRLGQDDLAQRAVLLHSRGRAHRDHRGLGRAATPPGARGAPGDQAAPTWMAAARSPSATWSRTRCACGPTASWSARCAAARRWTCCRP